MCWEVKLKVLLERKVRKRSQRRLMGLILPRPRESIQKIFSFCWVRRMEVLASWMKLKEANMSGPLRAETAIVAADPPRMA